MNKKVYIIAAILIILTLGSGQTYSYYYSQTSKAAEIQLEYQENWRAIETNIDSVFRLGVILTEEYKNTTNQSVYYDSSLSIQSEYRNATTRSGKYKQYLLFLDILDKIDPTNNSLVSDNELLVKSFINLNKVILSINEEVKLYNTDIELYNDIVSSKVYILFDSAAKEQDLLE